jgi:hypothetical protein
MSENNALVVQERNFKLASFMSQSELVPKNYRNKPANVFVAIQIADSMKMNPIIVMQSLYEVHGKFGWESKAIIGMANRSGVFKGGLNFKSNGVPGTKGFSVECYAIRDADNATCSAIVTWDMAVTAGWTAKNASAYKSFPEQMITYRAAAFFARKYCPEVMFGYYTTDEIRDISGAPQNQEPIQVQPINTITTTAQIETNGKDISDNLEALEELMKTALDIGIDAIVVDNIKVDQTNLKSINKAIDNLKILIYEFSKKTPEIDPDDPDLKEEENDILAMANDATKGK